MVCVPPADLVGQPPHEGSPLVGGEEGGGGGEEGGRANHHLQKWRSMPSLPFFFVVFLSNVLGLFVTVNPLCLKGKSNYLWINSSQI